MNVQIDPKFLLQLLLGFLPPEVKTDLEPLLTGTATPVEIAAAVLRTLNVLDANGLIPDAQFKAVLKEVNSAIKVLAKAAV